MSKGGGTTSTIDSRVFPLLQQNYKSAQGVAAKPFTPYTGQMVAPTTAAQQQGWDAVTSGALTAGQPTLTSAVQGATSAMGYKPQSVQAASSGVYGAPQVAAAPAPTGISRPARRTGVPAQAVPGAERAVAATAAPTGPAVSQMQGVQGLDAYMNPYIQNVADRTIADLDRFRQMSLNQNSSNASLSGAFGGDRLGVENALTNEAFAKQAGDTLAGLYSQGFDKSSGLLMSDKDRLLQNQQFNAGLTQQANLANQQAGLQGAGLNLQGAGLVGNLAGQQQQQLLTGANAVTSAGQQQQAQQQANLDAAYQEFQRELAYPYQQQQVLNSALGMFGSTSGTQNYQMPNYTAAGQSYANFSHPPGTTVICTELHRQGMLPASMLRHAEGYGGLHKTVARGYRVWATPLVRMMRRSARFSRFMRAVCWPLIVKLEQGGPDFTPAGVVLALGMAVSWLIGVLTAPAHTRQEA